MSEVRERFAQEVAAAMTEQRRPCRIRFEQHPGGIGHREQILRELPQMLAFGGLMRYSQLERLIQFLQRGLRALAFGDVRDHADEARAHVAFEKTAAAER